MSEHQARAQAHPNIAFIKYWGNRDDELRLPANSSLSMNLAGLHTRTHVRFAPDLAQDEMVLNGKPAHGAALDRVSTFLDIVRGLAGQNWRAQVETENNFPSGAGVASSASAFAALALAASTAIGLILDEAALSRLARRGSGSASRSVPGGYVEWQAGDSDADSYAVSIAPPQHWALVDCIAVVSQGHKAVGSSAGHPLAVSSPLQAERVAAAPDRLATCKAALLERDFARFAAVVEADSDLMHAVMRTSQPPLNYLETASEAMMAAVKNWRGDGLAACYTVDAGPNVHVICTAEVADEVERRLDSMDGVQQVLRATPGGPARLI
jgi:diphosphomevalonate decarboxylase